MNREVVDKFSLMLSSFADIKSAITEKGGSVSGEYKNYAKGVRSIYSDEEYTPQYNYPDRNEFLAADIFNKILYCAAVKEEIRLAIIDGGVECDSSVPLSLYGNKIRQISAAVPEFGVVNTTLPSGEARKPYYAKIEMTDEYDYKFEVVSRASWPAGLTLSEDGVITGTPTSTGYYSGLDIRISCNGKSRVVWLDLRIRPTKIYVRISAPDVVYDGEKHYASYTVYDSSMKELEGVEPIIQYGTNRASYVIDIGSYSISVSAPSGYTIVKPILGDTSIEVKGA